MNSKFTNFHWPTANMTVLLLRLDLKVFNRRRLRIERLLQVKVLLWEKILLSTVQCLLFCKIMRNWRKRSQLRIKNNRRRYSRYSRRTISYKLSLRMLRLRRHISRKKQRKQERQMKKPIQRLSHFRKISQQKHKTYSLKKVNWQQKRKRFKIFRVKSTLLMLRCKWFLSVWCQINQCSV